MWKSFFIGLVLFLICFSIGYGTGAYYGFPTDFLKLPFFSEEQTTLAPIIGKREPELLLNDYRIETLANQSFAAESIIRTIKEIGAGDGYTSYLISFQTQGKLMTGQLNVPTTEEPVGGFPVIVMLRGYVPENIYQTGVGTRNSAAVYAKNGFATIAPDFLGFGESDEDYEDTWKSRFIKPVQIAQLFETIKEQPTIGLDASKQVTLNPDEMGMWAHSNGGQIALTTLEITGKEIPTTLWAPVTAPFPYSIMFFSDELEDEGQQQRAWIALFEDNYDATDFSLSQHFDLLPATTIQLHHGTADDAALVTWSDEFMQKIDAENERRTQEINDLKEKIDTTEDVREKQKLNEQLLELETFSGQIDTTYHRYPGANHNLQPNWNEVVARDIEFFKQKLAN
jgi:pimeloyl-ACP methyl ester carboxylesterase